MTRVEFEAALAEKTGLSKKDVHAAVNAYHETVTEVLSKNDKLQFVGFGTFSTRKRAARVARDLRTKKTIQVPEKTVPCFKPGTALKDSVAEAGKKPAKKAAKK